MVLCFHFGTVPGGLTANQRNKGKKKRNKGDLFSLKPSVDATEEGSRRGREGPGSNAYREVVGPRGRELGTRTALPCW